MELAVLVEPLPGGGFRARSADPFGLTAQGETAEAALVHLRELIESCAASGGVLTTIDVPSTKLGPHPGSRIYEGDPLFDRWQVEIEAYRREIEEDPAIR